MSDTHDKNSKERFFCEICSFPLKSSEDFMYNSDYDCCHDCYLIFAEARRDEWKNSWRPEKKLIKNHIKQKKKLFMKRKEIL
jgi:hypothetical protein